MADRTIGKYLPADAECKTTNFPQPSKFSDTGGARPVLLFDASADETCYFTDIAPQGITGTLKAVVSWGMVSATSGNVILDVTIEAVTSGDTTDLDAGESLDTANASSAEAVPTTAGYMKQTTITLTNADSIAAGDLFRIRFRRVGSNGSDTATGDLVFHGLELRDNGL